MEDVQHVKKGNGSMSVVEMKTGVSAQFGEASTTNDQDHTEDASLYERICCLKPWDVVTSHRLWPQVSRILALLIFGLVVWGNMFSIVGAIAGPEGQLFRIAVLCVLAQVAGWIVHFTTLPPLLGMLLVGIILRNVNFIVLTGKYVRLASILRKMALVVILTRAGVGLDPGALRRLGGMVMRLTVIPALIEAIIAAVMSHYLLNLPWMWGFLLGAVLAAVSPAVVVPCLFHLQDKGYGRAKGIPTLLIAAATLNDILSISAFGAILSTIFSTGNLTVQILQGPLGILFGIGTGGICGLLLRCFPNQHDSHVVTLRTIILAAEGILLILGSEALGFDGAGPLGCIIAAFVASYGWRSQGWNEEKNPVEKNFIILWKIFQPILFALIGTEINLFLLDPSDVGLGVASLLGSLAVRIIISIVVVAGENLNWKERIFISFAWFPKATVQAAIGPVALDAARKFHLEEGELYGSQILMIAVLSILITAPIGAVLITMLGPRLLEKYDKDASESQPIQGDATILNVQKIENIIE